MSRLIDADRLLKELEQVWNIPDDWDGDIDETCETAFDIIENQPTAYDLDEVINELEEKSKYYIQKSKQAKERGLIFYRQEFIDKSCLYDDAIEIVKRGGIDEQIVFIN